MRRNLAAVVVLAALVFAAITAAVRWHSRWGRDLRAEVVSGLAFQFAMAGSERAAQVAECVAGEAEREIPARQMRAIIRGDAPQPPEAARYEWLRHCACDVVRDPVANCP